MGLSPEEISNTVRVPQRTIRTDIQIEWIRIRQIYQNRRAEYVARLDVQIDQLWREGWRLFLEQVRENKFFGKLAALNFLMGLASLKGRLMIAGRVSLSSIMGVPTKEGMAIKIERLTFDERIESDTERISAAAIISSNAPPGGYKPLPEGVIGEEPTL